MFLYLSDSAVLVPLLSIQPVIVFCFKTVEKKKQTLKTLMYMPTFLPNENTYSNLYRHRYYARFCGLNKNYLLPSHSSDARQYRNININTFGIE